MDKAAYACAIKHAGTYCVTVSVDGVEFLQPVEVGELVSLRASVHYVGNSSMEIGIHVTSENVKEGYVKHTNNSYFTMVAKGEDNKPTQVPSLILEDMNEVRHFIDAIKRRKLKGEAKTKLAKITSNFILAQDFHLLKGQRCETRLTLPGDFSDLYAGI